MKRSPLARKTPLKAGSSRLKTTTRLKKSGATKAKKVKRQRNYYASTVWKAKRKEALERAGYRCEYYTPVTLTSTCLPDGVHYEVHCQETINLHVHHKTNARFGGDERPDDLIVYCKYHHELVEQRDFPHRKHR